MLTIRLIPPNENVDFEQQFAAAYNEHERLIVVRHFLCGLLPDEKLRREYRWRVVPCGRGVDGLRLAIIETVRGENGVRLFLVSGGWLLDTLTCMTPEGAEGAAWAYLWGKAEATA